MAQVLFYRYADGLETGLIQQDQCIKPKPNSNVKYLSPDRYDTAADAQQFLALPYTPTHRIGPIPEDELPDTVQLTLVGPANNQPGGGLEAFVTKEIYLFSITRLN